jgi:hypothetical protein
MGVEDRAIVGEGIAGKAVVDRVARRGIAGKMAVDWVVRRRVAGKVAVDWVALQILKEEGRMDSDNRHHTVALRVPDWADIDSVDWDHRGLDKNS